MSDLIDRQAFLKQERKFYCEDCDKRKGMKNGKLTFCYEIGEAPCRACWCDDVLSDLKDYPAAPRWVRCEERLPEKGKWVLAISTFEKVTLYNIATVDAGGTWWTTSPKDIMREIYCVSHWMPIEPPKEDA